MQQCCWCEGVGNAAHFSYESQGGRGSGIVTVYMETFLAQNKIWGGLIISHRKIVPSLQILILCREQEICLNV